MTDTLDDDLNAIQQKINQIPVLCGLVVDRSGSMAHLTAATIQGMNEFIQEQKRVPGRLVLYVTLFDTTVEVPKGREIQDVVEYDEKTYKCDGMTALYDAVGVTVGILEKEQQVHGASKVIFCVITDGQENSSTEYNGDQVREMVKEKEAAGWDVLFLGSDLSVTAQAQNMGYAAASTANYTPTYAGTQSLHSTVSSYVTRSRTADAGVSNKLTDEERQALADPEE